MNNILLTFIALIVSFCFAGQTYIAYQQLQIEKRREAVLQPFYDIFPSVLALWNENDTEGDGVYFGDRAKKKVKKENKVNPLRPGVPLNAEDFLKEKEGEK